MVERTNEQQKMLEKRKADLADRRRAELEVAAQLEAQEEMGEELGKTYTSLQQEVDQFSCHVKVAKSMQKRMKISLCSIQQ
jgi:hypothetical protein